MTGSIFFFAVMIATVFSPALVREGISYRRGQILCILSFSLSSFVLAVAYFSNIKVNFLTVSFAALSLSSIFAVFVCARLSGRVGFYLAFLAAGVSIFAGVFSQLNVIFLFIQLSIYLSVFVFSKNKKLGGKYMILYALAIPTSFMAALFLINLMSNLSFAGSDFSWVGIIGFILPVLIALSLPSSISAQK